MFKKLIAVGATVVVALGIVALAALPAQAHTAAVSGKAVCSGPNTSVITWTISNDYGTEGTVTGVAGSAKGHLTPDPQNAVIPAAQNNVDGTRTYTQTVTGTASYDLNVTVLWKQDNFSMTSNDATAHGLANCTTNTTPGSVTPTQAQCDTQHPGQTTSASYVITAGSGHVTYTASVGGAKAVSVQAGVTNTVPLGSTAVSVVVTPVADSGYSLMGYDASRWQFTFNPVTTDCRSQLTVSGAPHVAPAICTAAGTVGNGQITFDGLPTGAKFQYSVSSSQGPWTDVTGPLAEAAGTTVYVQIVSTDTSKYTIVSGTTSFTEHVTSDPTNASHCVVPAALTPIQAICDSQHPGHIPTGSFVVPTSDSIVYTYNGDVVNGTTPTVTVGDSDLAIHVTATPKAGYAFPGNVSQEDIELDFNKLDHTGCVFAAAAAVPTFDDSACVVGNPGAKTPSDYVLGTVAGVIWNVQLNGGQVQDGVASGTYTTQPGDVVVVTETPDTGWQLTAAYPVGGYTHTFAKDAGDCLTLTQPVKADVTPQQCVVDQVTGKGSYTGGSIDLTDQDNVTYSIDGNVETFPATVKVGDVYSVPVTTFGVDHTVTANAAMGYKLVDYPAGGWTFNLKAADACGDLVTHPLVTPTFTPADGGCFSSSKYTLSTVEGEPDAVVWTVNGSFVSDGTYTLAAGKTVSVTAAPDTVDGFGFATGQQTTWTYTAPTSGTGTCDLKTLALTGVGSPIGWIGLGYLLLVGGIALIGAPLIMRRRRSAE